MSRRSGRKWIPKVRPESRLLQEAQKYVALNGRLPGLRILAQGAHASTALVYSHFGSMENLLLTIFKSGKDLIEPKVIFRVALNLRHDFSSALVAALEGTLEAFDTDPYPVAATLALCSQTIEGRGQLWLDFFPEPKSVSLGEVFISGARQALSQLEISGEEKTCRCEIALGSLMAAVNTCLPLGKKEIPKVDRSLLVSSFAIIAQALTPSLESRTTAP